MELLFINIEATQEKGITSPKKTKSKTRNTKYEARLERYATACLSASVFNPNPTRSYEERKDTVASLNF